MSSCRLSFLLLLNLTILTSLLAQQPSHQLSSIPQRIRFEHLTTADGLPENPVLCMIQDHLGFMWLGTQNGLVRYDGTTMTTFRYDPRKPFSLKGRRIRALHEDRNGDIWVGCERMFRYERSTGRFIEYPQSKSNRPDPEVRIVFIHEDHQGNLWTIKTQNNYETYVLDRLDPKTKTWLSFRHDQTNPHSLASDNMYLSDENVTKFSFAEAPDGLIWVVTKGATENVLHWFDPKTAQFNRFRPKASPAILNAFKKAGFVSPVRDQLYVASYVNGLFRLNPKTGQLIQFKHDAHNPASLQADSVAWLFPSRDGLIWVPNRQGLDRFDPKTGQFTHYVSQSNDPNTPSAGLVRSLHEMPNGDIWFVNRSGLSMYHRQSNRFIRYEHDPAGREGNLQAGAIISFLVDKTGLVWAGSSGFGLNKQSRLARFPLLTHQTGNPASLQSANVQTVYEAPSEPGIIWFGTDKGLDRLNKKTDQYTHYRYDSLSTHSLGKGRVTSLAEDKKGRFWVGTKESGLYQMNRKTGRFTHFVPDLKKNPNESRLQYIARLLPTSDGTLWVATQIELVHVDVDQQHYQYFYKTADAYPPDLFASIKTLLVPQRRIAGIVHPQGQVDQTVPFTLNISTDLCVVIGGSMRPDIKYDYGWIEDEKGQTVWEMTVENSKTDSFSDQRIEIKTLRLPAGRYRLRYRSDAVFYYGSWPMFPPIHADLWGVQILKLATTERGALNRLITQKYQRAGLSDEALFTFRQDKNGNIWTGSNDGGICMVNPATGQSRTWRDRFIGPGCVLTLLQDQSSGNWWVGDYANGLLLLDQTGKRIRSYNSTNGLPGNQVSAIQRDRQGWLWLMTDNGLCRFNPQTEQFLTFTDRNGIPTKGRGADDGSFKANDGQLYFWGTQGVTAFYPDQIHNDTHAPPVVLTDLAINGKPATLGTGGQLPRHISIAKDITLPHDQNDLTFQFAALSYNRGSESQYAFKLSPIDTTWVPIGINRQARFLDLRPGTYTFQVKAANADGVWNEKGTNIQLTILPPWWETWWAYLTYTLLLAAAIWTFIEYRSRALRRKNQLLEEKVADRTNEVQQQKEEIATQRDHLEATLEDLQKTQVQLIQKEKLASLGELTAGIAHEIQNPLNFVNNFAEVSSELVSELREEEAKPDRDQELIADLFNDLSSNLQKINHHGGRASSIVKGMLEHSRTSPGDKQPTNLNALADEYLKIAYHGQRANNKSFNCELVTHFDPDLGEGDVIPQDMGRVLLNLYNNAFYALQQEQAIASADYQPTIWVNTRLIPHHSPDRAPSIAQSTGLGNGMDLNGLIEIRVKDNGTGIPESVKAKIFQPFFTTKPTGEGTGLGLSLSYDIITKGHGGMLTVESTEGEGTTFIIQLPSHT